MLLLVLKRCPGWGLRALAIACFCLQASILDELKQMQGGADQEGDDKEDEEVGDEEDDEADEEEEEEE